MPAERLGDRTVATTIANNASISVEVESARRFPWIEGAIGADEALTVAYQSADSAGTWVTLDSVALPADTADTFVFRATCLTARVLVSNASGSTATLSIFEVNGRTEV